MVGRVETVPEKYRVRQRYLESKISLRRRHVEISGFLSLDSGERVGLRYGLEKC